MFSPAGNALLRVLLAPVCVSCRTPLSHPLDGPVCGACWCGVRLLSPPFCTRCGDALASAVMPDWVCARCHHEPPRFEMARSAGIYTGPLRELIHALKYDGRRMVALPLSRLMARAGAELLIGADAVVPVPLHPWRALRRGFNQADDLSRHLGPPVWRVLRRTRHGPPQATLPASHRQRNVAQAFASTRLPWRDRRAWRGPNQVQGRILVLVDDVMTTGATLNACAETLMAAGAASVRALTVARAVAAQPRPPLRRLPLSTVRRR